jgi:hypothetical protein
MWDLLKDTNQSSCITKLRKKWLKKNCIIGYIIEQDTIMNIGCKKCLNM